MRAHWLIGLAALAAFGGSVASGFHFDDYALLSDPAITSPAGWWQVWQPARTRPLTYFTFWINRQLGGTNPASFHVVNALLHAAIAVLLYQVLRNLIPHRAALIAAGLFAVHPIQAEAVAYIFSRGTLLNTLLCLLCLRSWIRGRTWIAVAWFFAALMAKEECVTLPLALAILHISDGRNRRELRPIAAMLLLAAAAGLRVVVATKLTSGSGAGFSAGMSTVGYFAEQGAVILRYLRLLVLPWGFTIDPQIRVSAIAATAAWVLIGVSIVFAIRRFAKAREGFWYLAGLILLIPSSSIFPAADLAADHRMDLPLIAFAPAIGIVARPSKNWLLLIAGAVLLALSIGRTMVWNSDERLWAEAVRLSPDKIRPRLQLARALPPPSAIETLQQAKAMAPDDAAVATELGRVYLELGRPADALQEFGRALALDPQSPAGYNNRGVALSALGQTAAARRDFTQALQRDACFADARKNLGLAPCR